MDLLDHKRIVMSKVQQYTDSSDVSDDSSDNSSLSDNENNSVFQKKASTTTVSDHSDNEKKQSESESTTDTETSMEQFNKNMKLVNDQLSQLSTMKKEHQKKEQELLKLIKQTQKTIKVDTQKSIKDLNSKMKKKPKRQRTVNSGFTKEGPIPLKLRKYLDIDDELLTRPAVHRLLNEKFKSRGFKDGKTTVISKKADATALGVEKGFTIKFSEMQTFMKKFYDEMKSQKTATN